MRLWTIHPKYLDAVGLVALWREGLLAQKVLRGLTKGYRHHPQLRRFRAAAGPVAAIAAYLRIVYDEACARGYQFDRSKLACTRAAPPLHETIGQLLFEWAHLRRKLWKRNPAVRRRWAKVVRPEAHPLFQIVPGEVQAWER